MRNSKGPFVGRTLRIVKVDLIERNDINVLIKFICESSRVTWTFTEDSQDEKFEGLYSSGHGHGVTAGWINATASLEHDHKELFRVIHIVDDWGLFHAENATENSL